MAHLDLPVKAAACSRQKSPPPSTNRFQVHPSPYIEPTEGAIASPSRPGYLLWSYLEPFGLRGHILAISEFDLNCGSYAFDFNAPFASLLRS